MLRAAAIAILTLGCGEKGGPCTYDERVGECELLGVTVSDEGDRARLTARYALPDGQKGALTHDLVVPSAGAAEARAHLERHARVACRARVLLSGACNPVVGTVSVPALGTPPPAGGACTYEDFTGTCTLVALDEGAPADGHVTLVAGYDRAGARPAGGPSGEVVAGRGGELAHELRVPVARAGVARAHLRAHAEVPCSGQRLRSGTCTPVVGTVRVPPLP